MYRLIEEPDRFGVQVGGLSIYDITTDHAEAERLLILLERESVSQMHAYDVIETWFAMEAYTAIHQ